MVNPVGISDRCVGSDVPSSVGLIRTLLQGKQPLLPRASFAGVDVRDRGRSAPEGHGASRRRRGNGSSASAGQPLTLPESAAILRSALGRAVREYRPGEVPDWMVRAGHASCPRSRRSPACLGRRSWHPLTKATELLGWQPRPAARTPWRRPAQSLLRLRSAQVDTLSGVAAGRREFARVRGDLVDDGVDEPHLLQHRRRQHERVEVLLAHRPVDHVQRPRQRQPHLDDGVESAGAQHSSLERRRRPGRSRTPPRCRGCRGCAGSARTSPPSPRRDAWWRRRRRSRPPSPAAHPRCSGGPARPGSRRRGRRTARGTAAGTPATVPTSR